MVINVSTSIFFVYNMKLGIFGVLVGSILAELLTLAIDPIIVFKYVFQKKAASFYFTYFKYLLIILATTVLLRFITGLYNSYSILGFAVSLMICMILPNLIWFLLFRNTEEFKYLSKAAFGVVNRVKSKLSKEINEK
ncbi:MAG: hypothetical protein HFH88_12325 [Lachnospiraceae bacterium]|nr:hypothetical protein [Lachnospiraceae bacterium]